MTNHKACLWQATMMKTNEDTVHRRISATLWIIKPSGEIQRKIIFNSLVISWRGEHLVSNYIAKD